MQRNERNYETIPAGALGVIALESCRPLGEMVDEYLVRFRAERQHEHENDIAFRGYQRDTYLMDCSAPRFGTGEAK
ncbi:MAG: ribose-phosphate pyrophosphokinase, partial [Lachnospiraceae bacterium]|nr:ribose-phosphate pyrophosphokinase [Lachnospiraceae bacterium]